MLGKFIKKQIRRSAFLFSFFIRVRDYFSFINYTMRGSFSQYGEDKFFKQFFSKQQSGRYLDIGASHPYRISNTFLLYKSGWSGITVEPIAYLANLHRQWRPKDKIMEAAIGTSSGSLTFFEMLPSVLSTLDEDTANNYINDGLAQLFKSYKIPVVGIANLLEQAFDDGDVDLLSMDVEGLDAQLLSVIDLEKYRPTLICIEANDAKSKAVINDKLISSRYEILRLDDNIIARAT